MKSYSDLIDRVLLDDELLKYLRPQNPRNRDLLRQVKAADDALLAGGKPIGDPAAFQLVRGGVLYGLDAIEECHPFFQDSTSDLASYWHGMAHRRECDFENARYWFRRAGALPPFAEMRSAASKYSADMARQDNWDPYLLTGQCEQEQFGAEELTTELRHLQQVEFELLFDYTWRQAFRAQKDSPTPSDNAPGTA